VPQIFKSYDKKIIFKKKTHEKIHKKQKKNSVLVLFGKAKSNKKNHRKKCRSKKKLSKKKIFFEKKFSLVENLLTVKKCRPQKKTLITIYAHKNGVS
jgi:hypothetical protein